jgi:RNA-directed DNA polymerase
VGGAYPAVVCGWSGNSREGATGLAWEVTVKVYGVAGKLRKLGIPTVADRVVQAALKLVLESIFEADFLPCSYGFRPMRRAQDAVAEIQHMTTRGYEWVLEADITACFDTIEHTVLMDRIRARSKDKKVLALVKAFLKAGVMTSSGDRQDTLTGTPQGGILSPLLSNTALSVLDEHFDRQWRAEMATWHHRDRRRRNGLGSWKLLRCADDFVLVVNGQRRHAQALRDEIAQVIAPLGLHLAPDKTRVVHIDGGFDFLGWHIRRMRKRGTASKSFVYTIPSRKAVQAVASSVGIVRYRYRERGYRARGPPTGHSSWLVSDQGTWRARCPETGTPGSGRRPAETDRPQGRHRAAGRPHQLLR